MKIDRNSQFKRNTNLEVIIDDLFKILNPVELKEIEKFKDIKCPIILINGVARSGTTLLMQWLANTELFAYPTNFISRFYGSPFIGGKIQQLLYDKKYNFNNELNDFLDKINFTSSLGKTNGPLAPNEFWYFWRRFFDFEEIQKLTIDQEKKVDVKTFILEIAAIQSVFNKTFVMKGMIVNWNLPFISTISDKIFFIHIKRNPIHNMRSLLGARKSYFGSEKNWYSFKPPEYEKLKNLSPIEQVAGQIFFTNKAISDGLGKINKNRWIEIDYEELCKEPKNTFEKIKKMINCNGYRFNYEYKGVTEFNSGNISKQLGKRVGLFMKAYSEFDKSNFQC